MPDAGFLFVLFIIFVALAFDFTNGMHDAANSIATVVSTRVLSPRQAVIWAAFFNFIAFLIFGTGVAHTVGAGMIDISIVTPPVIFAALLGAIGWNIFTWLMGLPTSSSHALIGGYAGAAIVKAGPGAIIVHGWFKTALFIFVAPLMGMVLGVAFITVTTWVVRKKHPARINRAARHLQLVSAALYSLGHGGNDAQKTMGQKITKLRPIDGFCAETASAISIFFATHAGVPVSTTHVITGAISGVGAAKRFSAVRWGVTLKIVWAWIFTIPGAALTAGLAYAAIRLVERLIA
jgi:PiT family inorganic phosphate transporter